MNIKMNDIMESENMILVRINVTKNKVPRSFTIADEMYSICKKYMQSRPADCSTDRFFCKYSKGKYIQQPIGINTFGALPKQIASYLNLADSDRYTGHSFRRTSATLLVDAGADITALKRHGGWKSTTVAEGYIADSLVNKRKIQEQISSGINLTKKYKISNIVQENENIITNSSSRSLSTSSQFQQVQVHAQHIKTYTFNSFQVTSHVINRNYNFQEPSMSFQYQVLQPHHQARQHNFSNNNASNSSIAETLTSFNEPDSEKSDIIITKDSVIGTPKQIQLTSTNKFKSPLFYDPDLGLYSVKSIDDLNEQLVFNNCNVKIQGGSHKSIVLNNCNIFKL